MSPGGAVGVKGEEVRRYFVNARQVLITFNHVTSRSPVVEARDS